MSESRLKNRIVDSGTELVSELQRNNDNWRLHPVRQKIAIKEAISHIGWVERVLVNLRTGDEWPADQRGVKTLVDGHVRLDIAVESGDETVPVDYVDLSPDEERYVLATLDPLGALARTDNVALLALTNQLDDSTKSVRAALRAAGIESREALSHLVDNGPENGSTGRTGVESGQAEPHKPAVVTGSAQAGQQKYPLAIVLSKQELSIWNSYKERVGIKTDTTAFLDLLRAVTDEEQTA